MGRPNLETLDFALPLGLNTRFTAEGQTARTLKVAQNVDGFDRFRGVSQIPGSSLVSDAHGAAVDSLHYFEYTDLDGARQREVLSFAGGTLRSIDTTTAALTSLRTGLTAETGGLVSEEMFNRLYLTGPAQRELPTGGLRYDGTNVRNWGIQAPGVTETPLDALDSAASWTASADATVTAVGAAQSVDGGGSLEVDKTGVASDEAYIEQSGMGLDLTLAGQDTLLVWAFIPLGTFQSFATSGAMLEVRFGDAGLADSDLHTFGVGELVYGWNLLSIDLTAPDSTSGGGAALGAVDTVRLTAYSRNAATTFSGLRWDHLHYREEARVTVALGGASVGGPAGTYRYRVTYLTEIGLESNAGPISAAISPDEEEVNLTNIPISTDPQVIARRIYRDISGDEIWRLVDQLNDNVTATYTDEIADADLTLSPPPIAGDASIDHSPPGRAHDIARYGVRMFIVDASDRSVIHVSDVNLPDAFRIIDQLRLEEEVVALKPDGTGALIIYCTDKMFYLQGDGVTAPIRVDEAAQKLGANGRRAVESLKALHVTVRERDLFLVTHPADPWLLSSPVLDKFQEMSDSELADMFIVNDRRRFRLILFPWESTEALVYQYGSLGFQQITGDGAGTDPMDTRTGAWWTMQLPTSVVPTCGVAVEREAEIPELWIGAEDGYVYWIGDPNAVDWDTGETSEAIEAIIEPHSAPLGQAPLARGEPRFLHANAQAPAAETWTATITLLRDADGPEVASYTTDLALASGRTAPIRPLRGGRAEWVSVRLTNANAGEGGSFSRLSLQYIPGRSGHRGPRGA